MYDDKPIWIWHPPLYHAFAWPKDHERGVLVVSACCNHFTRTAGTKCMGASYCLDCAEALGMELTENEIRPVQGLGYRREFKDPSHPACSYCGHEKEEWRSPQDQVGRTPSGLVAPQSAIDAMKKRG